MELDDAIATINGVVDEIESGFGTVSDRTVTVAGWLMLLDRGIKLSKEDWADQYSSDCYPQGLMANMATVAAIGVCCLEQYTNIYEESCPWEHDFSYDDQLAVEEALIIMDDRMHTAKYSYYHDEEDLIRSSLEEVKEIVILAVSCMLQHGIAIPEESVD